MTRADLDALALPKTVQGGITYTYLLREMESGRLIVPDYQRGRVWTPEQAGLFVGFVLTSGQPPPIWIQQHPDADREEIIDGLQRVSAMRDFFADKIPAILPNGVKVLRSGLDSDCDGLLKSLHITKMIVSLATRAEVLHLYLRLNRGGTVHSDAEIRRVQDLLLQESPE